MKLFLVLFVLAVAGAVGWYFYCVNPVIQDFQAAVDSGKPEAITPFLDIPSLKKNVTDYVKLRYNQPDRPAADLTPDQAQAMVDSFVTPENIVLLMKGVKLEPGAAPPTATDDKASHPVEKHYLSPDAYAIDIYLSQVQTDDNKVSLIFQRVGALDWKLMGFKFSWGG
jgi:hypothetical protein